jgi:hypothetical protein
VSISSPFYISIDPRLNFTETRRLTTKFVYMTSAPEFREVFFDKFSFSVAVREAL